MTYNSRNQAFFVASTGQHVGKTTTCLGLVSGLKKRFNKVSFLKPIGQESLETDSGILVDKDVPLFKDYFKLDDPYELMSPILFSKGFTRDYLDGKIELPSLMGCLDVCYEELLSYNDCIVVEGTGHTGVGTIIDFNNAQVAARLKTPIILIASGGLGSSLDAIALNKALCDKYNVPIVGVILNKVIPSKKEMVMHYMQKGLSRWDIPLLGCIPYDPFLSNPTISDYANLFKTELISGQEHSLRHFEHIRFVATSLDVYKTLIRPSQLVITPASREDIIMETLTHHFNIKKELIQNDLLSGIILTGNLAPKDSIIESLKKANIPAFYIPIHTFNAMKMITSYIAKLRKEDTLRIEQTIAVVEAHIDFDHLLNVVGITNP